MVWTRPALTGAAPSPRYGHAAAVVGGEIFMFGGMASTGYSNELHVLKLTDDLLPAGVPPHSPPPPPAL
jgi:hypothetical protein